MHTLLTGATGLLGRYLLRNLLAQGTPVAVVVRPSEKRPAVDRIEDILHLWESQSGASLPSPACLVGDVQSKDLGLDSESRSWIREHCDRVMHSAAALNLHGSVRDGEPRTTNVEGTRNVLHLCREADIGELHYVSTVYVSGCRQGRILESELDEGQDFRNDYEASKFEAEQLVCACRDLESLTVYRPAVIAGDSVTGYTSTYHGLYLYLRLMAMVVPMQPVDEDGRHQTPIRLPMGGDELRNVVPVDWVADVITEVISDDEAHGRTYHVAPDRPLTPRKIIDACCRYFNSTGVEFVGAGYEHDCEDMSDFERAFLHNMTIYEPYAVTDAEYDTANLERFAGHLPCPVIDEAMLHRYLRYAERDRWGRRRHEASQEQT